MKFDIVEWAYEAELPEAVKGGAHAVLIALAYSANFKTAACFPSIKRLAHLTRMKETAVKNGLKTLKQLGIISIAKKSGSKKFNQYVINYTKVKRKAKTQLSSAASYGNLFANNGNVSADNRNVFTHTIGAESDPISQSCGRNPSLEYGRNPPTNKEQYNNIGKVDGVSSSSNMEQSFEVTDDDRCHTHTNENEDTPAVDLQLVDDGPFIIYKGLWRLFAGRKGQKLEGMEAAMKLTIASFEKLFAKPFDPSNKMHQEMVDDLATAISIYPKPVTFADLKNICTCIQKSHDWYILEDTLKNVQDIAICDRIENPRAYILKSLRDNIANGTAEHLRS